MQALGSLAEGLALAVLHATPTHLQHILAKLPPSMHALAMHAECPEISASGALHLDCNDYSLSAATAALELFASSGEHNANSRSSRLHIAGIACVEAPDNRNCNHNVRGFSSALLRCCALQSCTSASLAFQGDDVHLNTVFNTLSNRGVSLRSLTLSELPNTYFFSFTRKSRLKKRNEQAELLASSFSQLSGLQHLSIHSQTKWTDNIVHASACWDVSSLTQLTYLCMHNANCCVCAPHLAASVTRCMQLMHLGVCLNLRKCPPDACGHDHSWLSSLRSLTSLSLRCADERVSFRNGISFCHGGGEAHEYLSGLFSKSLFALTRLKQLHIFQTVLSLSTVRCIVDSLHGSLQDLSVAMHVASVPHALAVVHILHKAVLLTKLSFDYHCQSSIQSGGVEEPHETLCKYLCCLRALRHLRLHMHAGPDLPMGQPLELEGSGRVPVRTVAALSHLELNSPEFLGGFIGTAHAHLTSLQSISVTMKAHADGSTAPESLGFGRVISQQPGLRNLVLYSSGLTSSFVLALAGCAEICTSLQHVSIDSAHDMPAASSLAFGSFLSSLTCLTSLQLHIRVSGNFPEVLAEALARMQRLQNLTLQLTLQYDNVPRRDSDSAYRTIAHVVASLTCLEKIDVCIHGVGLGEQGAVAVARQLRILSTLQCLALGNVQLSDALVSAIAVSATSLKFLKLRGTEMHPDAAVALVRFLSAVPSLRSVSVQGRQNYGRCAETREAARIVLNELGDDDPMRCSELRKECS